MAKRRVRVPKDLPDTPLHVRLIHAIRRQRNWTQEEFADSLNVSVRTVRQWEHQTKLPKRAWLLAFQKMVENDYKAAQNAA